MFEYVYGLSLRGLPTKKYIKKMTTNSIMAKPPVRTPIIARLRIMSEIMLVFLIVHESSSSWLAKCVVEYRFRLKQTVR